MFQLHPNGYRFADGHVVKLELLPKDSNTAAGNSYGRTSNNQQNVTIENLSCGCPCATRPARSAVSSRIRPRSSLPAGLPARARLSGTAALLTAQGSGKPSVPLVLAYDGVHGPAGT